MNVSTAVKLEEFMHVNLPNKSVRKYYSMTSQIKSMQTGVEVTALDLKKLQKTDSYAILDLLTVADEVHNKISELSRTDEEIKDAVQEAGLGNPIAKEKMKGLISNILVNNRLHVKEDTLISNMSDIDSVFAKTCGFDLIDDLKDEDGVEEIQINGLDIKYYKNGKSYEHPRRFSSLKQVENLQNRLATYGNTIISESNPRCQTYTYSGSRLTMTRPKFSREHSICLRNFVVKDVTLDILAGNGTMNKEMAELLKLLVAGRASIAIAGGTFTGKTTLLFALLAAVSRDDRIITLEKEFELNLAKRLKGVRNIVELREVIEAGLTMEAAFEAILTMSPTWIVVGESKGAEISQAISAGTRGHNVMVTLHSKYSELVDSDIIEMTKQDGRSHDEENLRARIAKAFNIVLIPKFVTDQKGETKRVLYDFVELALASDGTVTKNILFRYSTTKNTWVRTKNMLSHNLIDHMRNCGLNIQKLVDLGFYEMPPEEDESKW